MLTIAAFNLLLLGVAAYSVWCGGAPERLVAVMMTFAALATLLAPWDAETTYRTVHLPMLVIDAALFCGLSVVAMFADRFWPLWLASMQLVALSAHGARAYDPGILAIAYWWLVNKVAYPMLGLLAVGTARHHARAARQGWEWGWTHQRRLCRSHPSPSGSRAADVEQSG